MERCRRRFRAVACMTACLLSAQVGMTHAAQSTTPAHTTVEARQEMKDAVLTGKVEMLFTLNRQLNPLDIDTRVSGGIVYLTGSVETEVERELAEELVRSVDGVIDVRNDLRVASAANLSNSRRAERESLAKQRTETRRWIEDATTSAVVKSKLLANQNTKGLNIKVDTRNGVVTLSGQVASAEERQLVELLARNTENVAEVRNELRVGTARAARTE